MNDTAPLTPAAFRYAYDRGLKLTKPIHGPWVHDDRHGQCYACAVGTFLVGLLGPQIAEGAESLPQYRYRYTPMQLMEYILNLPSDTEWRCCECGNIFSTARMMVHYFEAHEWSREEVGYWVEQVLKAVTKTDEGGTRACAPAPTCQRSVQE